MYIVSQIIIIYNELVLFELKTLGITKDEVVAKGQKTE